MTIDWKDPEVKERLLIALIASMDGPVNCREIARLFGGDATYSTIENHLRKPRREAKALKLEAEGKGEPAPSPTRPKFTKSASSTPKKADSVKSGRVTKSTPKGRKVPPSPLKTSLEGSVKKGSPKNKLSVSPIPEVPASPTVSELPDYSSPIVATKSPEELANEVLDELAKELAEKAQKEI